MKTKHYKHTGIALETVRLVLGAFGVSAMLLAYIYMYGSTHFAHAAINQQINYQGKLTLASNVAVADGTYNMRFWLAQSLVQATTSAVWTESLTSTNRVTVSNGLFSIMLGSTSPLSGVNFNQTLYLGVEIGGTNTTPVWDGEMSPRKILGAVPAAFVADTLDGIDSTQFVRNDQTNTIASSSALSLLTITQNGAGNIFDAKVGAITAFTILNNGNVGIGSSSPSAKLSVNGEVNAGFFTATSTTEGATRFTISRYPAVGTGALDIVAIEE